MDGSSGVTAMPAIRLRGGFSPQRRSRRRRRAGRSPAGQRGRQLLVESLESRTVAGIDRRSSRVRLGRGWHSGRRRAGPADMARLLDSNNNTRYDAGEPEAFDRRTRRLHDRQPAGWSALPGSGAAGGMDPDRAAGTGPLHSGTHGQPGCHRRELLLPAQFPCRSRRETCW